MDLLPPMTPAKRRMFRKRNEETTSPSPPVVGNRILSVTLVSGGNGLRVECSSPVAPPVGTQEMWIAVNGPAGIRGVIDYDFDGNVITFAFDESYPTATSWFLPMPVALRFENEDSLTGPTNGAIPFP